MRMRKKNVENPIYMRGIKLKADCTITQSYSGTIRLALCCVRNSTKISKIVFNHHLFWT